MTLLTKNHQDSAAAAVAIHGRIASSLRSLLLEGAVDGQLLLNSSKYLLAASMPHSPLHFTGSDTDDHVRGTECEAFWSKIVSEFPLSKEDRQWLIEYAVEGGKDGDKDNFDSPLQKNNRPSCYQTCEKIVFPRRYLDKLDPVMLKTRFPKIAETLGIMGKKKRKIHTECDKGRRGDYLCGNCQEPLKGHECPFVPIERVVLEQLKDCIEDFPGVYNDILETYRKTDQARLEALKLNNFELEVAPTSFDDYPVSTANVVDTPVAPVPFSASFVDSQNGLGTTGGNNSEVTVPGVAMAIGMDTTVNGPNGGDNGNGLKRRASKKRRV